MIPWLKIVELGLSLLNSFVGFLHDQKLIDAGAAKAVAAGLAQSLDEIRKAQGVRTEADQAHAADPTDKAFDSDFERKD